MGVLSKSTRRILLKKLCGKIEHYSTDSSNLYVGNYSQLISKYAVKANYKPKASNCKNLSYNAGNYTTRPLYKGSNIWIVSSDLNSRWHTVPDEKEIVKQKNKQVREETAKVAETKRPSDFKKLISYHQRQNVIKLSMQE